ncbi:hypothetical protein Sgly_1413 [Syntrophobotulus glycolicus DSM 8271]|uniref:Lipoprotein n=1 Tax=Syntrophobotulus glycolicus (strain DSM 8271 / FlGlyR) TaxID=645991 RepID=F0SWF0_SYNGF|nr:hypothetical protein [Syntrophobotulus glycolicus]ADY55716.1 hypothetical protein Sgly_1413 [Syntrophobotulus glycolicus DSM 8271]
MRKKTAFLLVLVFALFLLVSCANEQTAGKNSELENFLNQDDQVIEKIKNQPIGATGPRLVYAYDQYAVILNFNGILIYDFDQQAILHTIDNLSLGLNKMQGSDYTSVKSNRNELAFGNESDIDHSAYVYHLQKNELHKANKKELEEFKEVKEVDQELLNSILTDGHTGNAVYNEDGNIVLLTYRYEDGADGWALSILEKDRLKPIQQVKVFQ